jgi:hypothetical protein
VIVTGSEYRYSAGFARRWYVYATFPLVFVMFLLSGIVSFVPGVSAVLGSNLFSGALTVIGVPVAVVFFGSIFWAIPGYYWDAKALRAANAEWEPLWWLWLIGHLTISPVVAIPVYWLRRTQKTGLPPRVRDLVAAM